MNKVLIIEDDPHICDLIALHLQDMDCHVTKHLNGREGFEAAIAHEYALIILDLMLPEMDGLAICQKLRALDNHTPILMLTAKAEEFDKVMGLESGADDYMTKPFGIREFIARVKAILRRESRKAGTDAALTFDIIQVQNICIDKKKHKVTADGNRIALTPKEYDLLLLLASHPGHSYTREQLLELVWGYQFSGYEHTVNSHVNRLRAKIETDVNHPQYILTTWGVGYRFNDEL
jgi:DNA-binding response OmpR family regulator